MTVLNAGRSTGVFFCGRWIYSKDEFCRNFLIARFGTVFSRGLIGRKLMGSPALVAISGGGRRYVLAGLSYGDQSLVYACGASGWKGCCKGRLIFALRRLVRAAAIPMMTVGHELEQARSDRTRLWFTRFRIRAGIRTHTHTYSHVIQFVDKCEDERGEFNVYCSIPARGDPKTRDRLNLLQCFLSNFAPRAS